MSHIYFSLQCIFQNLSHPMPRPKLCFDCWLNLALFGSPGSDHLMIDKTVLIPNYGLLSFDQKNNLSDIHETGGRYPPV